MKPPEMTKTVLDMEAPRFDVGGDKITGEYDCVKTPELTVYQAGELQIVTATDSSEYDLYEVTSLNEINTNQWREFYIGLAIGVMIAAVGFVTVYLTL